MAIWLHGRSTGGFAIVIEYRLATGDPDCLVRSLAKFYFYLFMLLYYSNVRSSNDLSHSFPSHFFCGTNSFELNNLYLLSLITFSLFFCPSFVTQSFIRSTCDGLVLYKPALLTLTVS